MRHDNERVSFAIRRTTDSSRVDCFRGDVLLDLMSRIVRGREQSFLAGFSPRGVCSVSPNIFLTAGTPHVNSASSYYGVAFEA